MFDWVYQQLFASSVFLDPVTEAVARFMWQELGRLLYSDNTNWLTVHIREHRRAKQAIWDEPNPQQHTNT